MALLSLKVPCCLVSRQVEFFNRLVSTNGAFFSLYQRCTTWGYFQFITRSNDERWKIFWVDLGWQIMLAKGRVFLDHWCLIGMLMMVISCTSWPQNIFVAMNTLFRVDHQYTSLWDGGIDERYLANNPHRTLDQGSVIDTKMRDCRGACRYHANTPPHDLWIQIGTLCMALDITSAPLKHIMILKTSLQSMAMGNFGDRLDHISSHWSPNFFS